MSESGQRQRLAAILAADVTGYSRLMASDAAGTVATLDAARAVFRRFIESNRGRVIDMAGDSVLAVFELASGAAAAAVAIQKELAAETRMRFRIGVHLGEIIEKDDGTVYGDGVNIAARVQAVAQSGGICVTQQVYDHVHDRLGIRLIELGVGELKNIQAQVRIYRVVLPWEKAVSPWLARLSFVAGRKETRQRVLAALVVIAIAVVAGWVFWPSTRGPDPRAADLFSQAKALTSHSSSHLENKSNNLAAIQLLEKAVVIDPEFAEAHAKLGLAYVIRLFLFAPEETDLQQKAYLSVERAFQLNPNLAEAYEARGRLRWTVANHFPHQDAIRNFQQALKLNPDLEEAHHYLGLVLLHVGLLEEGRQAFRETIRINPSNNGAQYRIGESYFYGEDHREALKVFENIDPAFNPDLHSYQSSWSLYRTGRKAQAVARLAKSLESFPGDRGGLLTSTRAMIHAAEGERAEAEAAIHAASERRGFGHFHHTAYNIASAYALMNDKEQALEWFERALRTGFNCYPMFEKDASLANIRGEARFKALLAEERKKFESYKALFSKPGR